MAKHELVVASVGRACHRSWSSADVRPPSLLRAHGFEKGRSQTTSRGSGCIPARV
jgi:hypothetical protein